MAYQNTPATLIDYVLTRLRKPTLSARSITDISSGYPYELMIMGFVMDALREIERTWDWQELTATQTITINAAANTGTGPTNGSRQLYSDQAVEYGEDSTIAQGVTSYPLIWDVTTSTAAVALEEITAEQMEALHLTDQDNTTAGAPEYFAWSNSASGTMQLQVWPTPSTQRTIKAQMFVPHGEFAAASITNSIYGTNLPVRLVGMKALILANQERGSNLGAPDSALQTTYDNFLVDLIMDQMTDEDLTGYAQ